MQGQFEKSQFVRYGANGVCRIEDVRPIPEINKQSSFYVLKPLADQKSVYYIPTDSKALTSKLRPPLTRDEIDAAIDSVKDEPLTWIEDRSVRLDTCRAALRENDTRQTLLVVGMLYQHKQQLAADSKKLSASDEAALKEAQTLIENEFSFVLGLTKDEIEPYIRKRLDLS